MLNKLSAFVKKQGLIQPGDHIICAVSGGADSMALLWAMYLLREKLEIRISAAHFNHGLRGEESDSDEAFVREFCAGYGIEFFCGSAQVKPGKKGLEAAAREARYAFLRSLPGKVATAHTADDNAETVLMHLLRGTGLKGLGGISPVTGNVIRPMLEITRQEVVAFLDSYCVSYVNDSSNDGDDFLRNRLRHQVMPFFKGENPMFSQKVSALALNLRQEEQILADMTSSPVTDVETLRKMPGALRRRHLLNFLRSGGVSEPEEVHVDLAEQLVFSRNPSGRIQLPAGILLSRNYGSLEIRTPSELPDAVRINVPGVTELPQWGIRVTCAPADCECFKTAAFTVGELHDPVVRSRTAGDSIRLSGGTKSLKKLFIDHKIPARDRDRVPVLADDRGVVAVCGFGVDLDRYAPSGWLVSIETL